MFCFIPPPLLKMVHLHRSASGGTEHLKESRYIDLKKAYDRVPGGGDLEMHGEAQIPYGTETWATTKKQEKRIEIHSKRDENATMDVRTDTQRQDQERTHRGTTRVTQATKMITER